MENGNFIAKNKIFSFCYKHKLTYSNTQPYIMFKNLNKEQTHTHTYIYIPI